MTSLHHPFGQPACEAEVRLLKEGYSNLYFDETPFNAQALLPETYLIVGRRGSGKTALAQSFSFQEEMPGTICLDADRPDTYQQVLAEVSCKASESRAIAIPQLRGVWEYVIWSFICSRLAPSQTAEPEERNRIYRLIQSILEGSVVGELVHIGSSHEERLDQRIRRLLSGNSLERGKAHVLRFASRQPVFITIDTLEQYDVNDSPLMFAMAALIEFASGFNAEYADKGIHLKLLMSGEIMPYLQEHVLLNTLKSIRDPVYLLWRPKDLLRMICWRLYRYLQAENLLRQESKGKIDWTDYHEVLNKMWTPYFGESVTNLAGKIEQTFPYVLRHTQMRPRQLIFLCNSIARTSIANRRFPRFSEEDIRRGIQGAETVLAVEIINSFSSLYPRVGSIVDALRRIPKVFTGNELDRRAKESASAWPEGAYSPHAFNRLVTEIGIVGRVRRHNQESGFIDADFEYSIADRLIITHRDECVIHPMFYSRLGVEMNTDSRVMPFSTERADND
jgi:hypothetical protein